MGRDRGLSKGKKDSFSYQPPVDHYRKTIGKQDYKKSRTELKESKKRAQSKKTTSKTYREIGKMLAVLIAALSLGYFISYVFLTQGISSLWSSPLK
ncbi:triple QxxK/R motif-containing protein isoform X2 [Ixodes scapularis]|nr:triple QxxK/R motif-containing protein isoform X2 [Ixodes scapularis]XP_040354461.1 triple QxxK/R motif-containing protein isoform X2 [Ixodes scapularis]